jgi:dUTP pyrophosphatase
MGTKAEDTAENIGFIDDLLEECKETELLTKQKKEFIFSLLNFIKDGLTDFNKNPIPSIDVGVKILDERARMPEYAHLGDSGVDVFALEDIDVQPKDTVLIQLGLAFQLPLGYELQARPKSGITLKTKCRVQLGTIDSIYRGEVGIIVDNIGDEVISIKAGQKVAQLVPAKVPYMNLTNIEKLNETDRAEGGFGSTGV